MSNPVLQAAAINSGMGDEFAWVQGWRFAICDFLTWDLGENVPGFLPGASFGPETDSFEYEELVSIWPEAEEAQYALKILDRYREWVRIAGKDY